MVKFASSKLGGKMNIGSVAVYLNHPVVAIGATVPLDGKLELGGAPQAASGEHVLVAARAQSGLVQVRLWSRLGPCDGAVIFDGNLLLGDGVISVADATGSSCYYTRLGAVGAHRVTVSVDDPGAASRIDVLIDSGGGKRDLTAVPGYPLPQIGGIEGSLLEPADELGLILSAHDLPFNRLAAAIKLIHSTSAVETDGRRKISPYRLRMIAEWIRWLRPALSIAKSQELADMTADRLRGDSKSDSDAVAIEAAADVFRNVNIWPFI
ncbi:hypothetical protein ACFU7Y_11565 [Kitasatospora sp. NPDC057542]|uniref:hypothetical protein n=1 Tax=Kitasatospora sp. NPDC057542 TaxID=3346162 RepID=UPI0036826168